jgi:hypothetical protein
MFCAVIVKIESEYRLVEVCVVVMVTCLGYRYVACRTWITPESAREWILNPAHWELVGRAADLVFTILLIYGVFGICCEIINLATKTQK